MSERKGQTAKQKQAFARAHGAAALALLSGFHGPCAIELALRTPADHAFRDTASQIHWRWARNGTTRRKRYVYVRQ